MTTTTPYWMSTECIRGEHYDQRADVFNSGILLCETIARVELMMAGKENSTTTRDDDSTSNEEEDEMRNAAGIEARWWKRQKK